MNPHLILDLPCGCTLTEDKDGIHLYRSLDCSLQTHFTNEGWPSLIDAHKAEIVHDSRK